MNDIRRSALLPYSAELIYQLINDVEAYPQYMDGCVGAEVLLADESMMEARLDLSRAGIYMSLCTRNHLPPPRRTVLELLGGPLVKLRGDREPLALGDLD